MKDFTLQNASKSRRAVAIGCTVMFMVRSSAGKQYRSPRQWLKKTYRNHQEAVQAVIKYVGENRVLGIARPTHCNIVS